MNSNLFNPWSTKDTLRWFLPRLKEAGELDDLLAVYLSNYLGFKIIHRPSKGPYGEQGKDIVVEEDAKDRDYCSYIVKQGTLHKNLEGKYGILKQVKDAITIDLDLRSYQGAKRTAVVVHNGNEGYRGAVRKFEDECIELEVIIGKLLTRPITRWDIEELTDRFWDAKDCLTLQGEINSLYDRQQNALELIIEFKTRFERIQLEGDSETNKSMLTETLYEMIKNNENFLGPLEGK